MPNIEDVKNFWNTNPLFKGEGMGEVGSREWFEHHERVYETDCIPNASTYEFISSDIVKDSRILDVGCGPGYWVRYFLRKGFPNISACDLTPQAVELTHRSLEQFSLSTQGEIIEGNAEALPFDAQSFDHINCQGVIHHTPDTEKCVAEFHRVLKTGGTACFSIYYKNFILRSPTILNMIQRCSGAIGMKSRGRDQIIKDATSANDLVRLYDGADNPIGKAYTRQEALDLLTYNGQKLFDAIGVRRFFFPARALPVPIPKWAHRLLDQRAGLLIIIKARKCDA